MAAPRDALLALGPFDPALHLYGEDMDLGLRASREGIPSYLCPRHCRVVHHRRGSAAKRFPAGPEATMARNRRFVLRRAYGGRRELSAWRAQRLNLVLRVLAKRALRRNAHRDRVALTALAEAPATIDGEPPPPPAA